MTRWTPRALVLLRRIAIAIERLAPPPPRRPRHVEFSSATAQTFEEGYDARGTEELDAPAIRR
jgi:hypothetical protein